MLLGAAWGVRLGIFFHIPNFPFLPCVRQSITISSLTLLCAGSSINVEGAERRSALHHCYVLIITALHRPAPHTHRCFDPL